MQAYLLGFRDHAFNLLLGKTSLVLLKSERKEREKKVSDGDQK